MFYAVKWGLYVNCDPLLSLCTKVLLDIVFFLIILLFAVVLSLTVTTVGPQPRRIVPDLQKTSVIKMLIAFSNQAYPLCCALHEVNRLLSVRLQCQLRSKGCCCRHLPHPEEIFSCWLFLVSLWPMYRLGLVAIDDLRTHYTFFFFIYVTG